MKLLLLHLSDMHFCDKGNYNPSNIDAIVRSLRESILNIQNMIILVSGDLSFSGKKEECKQVNAFFKELKRKIEQSYSITDCQIVFVPGNHDIDYTNGDRGSSGLALIEKANDYNEHIEEELNKQKQFYILSEMNNCLKQGSLIQKISFTYGSIEIQINLINTAIFSSLENDQGFHYLPPKDINTLIEQGSSDFIITVMHHPHHWYSECCKKQLEKALYDRSDIIFVGHEHYESTQKVENEDSSVNIFSGGRLCNKGNWDGSEFHVGLLDLETREYLSKKYYWNEKSQIYVSNGNEKPTTLSKDRYNHMGLSVHSTFSHEFYEDKYLLADTVLEYFVFPLLIEEKIEEDDKIPDEISDIETFVKKTQGKRRIVISGSNGSGKSILLRAICNELKSKKLILFVDGKKYNGSNESILKDSFERMYTKDPLAYQLFLQTDPSTTIILVDDIDAINEKKQDDFIEFLLSKSETIILTCQSEIDIDIKSRLKKRTRTDDSIFLHIARFYSNKRKELISNIVHCIGERDAESQENIINTLNEALAGLKYAYRWNPDFLVQFVKYYCNNVGEASHNDGNVFSKVFEHNLISLIAPYAKADLVVDKIFVVLDKIAFYVYDHKKYPITLSEIESVINKYNEDFAATINTYEFVKILMDSKVVKEYGSGFIFYERNYLAYFVAREIKRQCIEGDMEHFHHILDCSYMQINMDILMFITYIVDSPLFIKNIMNKAMEIVNGWKEYDYTDKDISFLVNGSDYNVNPVSEEDIKREEKKDIDREKEEAKELLVRNEVSIFEGESEELNYIQRIMRAISLMIVVARILPSFEQIIEAREKRQCVNLIYTMPLQIFRSLAEQMDNERNELLAEIKEYHDFVYRKEKPDMEALTDEKALYILRWEAFSMLLELMNSSLSNATRRNTVEFIDCFPYMEKSAYRIEHLMSLERRRDVNGFEKEAINLYENNKNAMVKTAIQRITRHFIIKTPNLKPSDRDRINTKIYGSHLHKGKLLAETNRNKRRN